MVKMFWSLITTAIVAATIAHPVFETVTANIQRAIAITG